MLLGGWSYLQDVLRSPSCPLLFLYGCGAFHDQVPRPAAPSVRPPFTGDTAPVLLAPSLSLLANSVAEQSAALACHQEWEQQLRSAAAHRARDDAQRCFCEL